jgi:hypothetical protein
LYKMLENVDTKTLVMIALAVVVAIFLMRSSGSTEGFSPRVTIPPTKTLFKGVVAPNNPRIVHVGMNDAKRVFEAFERNPTDAKLTGGDKHRQIHMMTRDISSDTGRGRARILLKRRLPEAMKGKVTEFEMFPKPQGNDD